MRIPTLMCIVYLNTILIVTSFTTCSFHASSWKKPSDALNRKLYFFVAIFGNFITYSENFVACNYMMIYMQFLIWSCFLFYRIPSKCEPFWNFIFLLVQSDIIRRDKGGRGKRLFLTTLLNLYCMVTWCKIYITISHVWILKAWVIQTYQCS